MAFVFAMEVTKHNFFSSGAAVSPASMVPLFAVVFVIAVVPLVTIVSLAPPSIVAVLGVTRFFFRHCVHYLVLLRMVRMPWLQVRSVSVLRPLLLIHLLKFLPLPMVRFVVLLHYLEEFIDCLRLAPLQVLSARAQVHTVDCGIVGIL